MKKIPFSSITLRKKLLFSIYLILFTVIVFSTVLAVWLQYRADKNRNIQLYQRFTQTACADMEYLLQDVLDISDYFAVNTEIERVLNTSGETQYSSTLFWEKETPLDFLKDILAIKSHIKNVILYPENGKTPFYISRDASVFDTDISHLRETEIYEKSLAARGDMVWDKVEKGSCFPFLKNMSDKIVAHRELFDLAKKKRLGHLVISMNASTFEQICKQMLQNSDESAVVLNREGQVFLSVGETDQKVMADIRNQNFEKLSASSIPEILRIDGHYVFPSRSSRTGITVYYISPYAEWRAVLQMQNLIVPVLLLLALAAVFFPLSALISISLTRPIERLSSSMERFKEGDFNQHLDVSSHDEIGQLSDTFNKMVTDLRELIDKNYVMTLRQKEMELNTLQSQINPHFLYNVLDFLYWQAINQENEELADDILVLSKLFRMVLSQGRAEISVAWEVELVTCYLQIQKMRFSRRLNYEINVDEEIMQYTISKLMLQPFIENAVVHGLEMQKEGGMVKLTGYKKDGRMYFQIADNGVGMEQADADKLLEDGKNTESFGHYAIRNVRDRLALKYGENYELKIESKTGIGTTVTISIPLPEKEVEDLR